MTYVESLEIENVRCFGKRQRIEFTDKNGNISKWTVILGDNGTGKTSILKAVAALLPSPRHFLDITKHSHTKLYLSIWDTWRNTWNLKRKGGEEESVISLTIAKTENNFALNAQTERAALSYRETHSANMMDNRAECSAFDAAIFKSVYCFAYGANRKMAVKSLTSDIQTTSETLFRDDAMLQNASEYFLRLDYESSKSRKGSNEKDRVKDLLLKVLPGGITDIQIIKVGRLQREVQVKTEFGWVNLNELSLGYKTSVAWLIDFATKMIYYMDNSPSPFDEPAVLLIDEIDLHMHPAWQREIIDNLNRVFTKTQFIVTAHSPLIAQAALDTNLVLLKRKDDYVEVDNRPEVVKSWRIDQVLTSDLFGLQEARPKTIERKMQRRRTLLKQDTLTAEEHSELNELNQEIYAMPIGETKSEIDAMEILRDFANKINSAKKP